MAFLCAYLKFHQNILDSDWPLRLANSQSARSLKKLRVANHQQVLFCEKLKLLHCFTK